MKNTEEKSADHEVLSLKHNITQWHTIVDAMSESVFLIDSDRKIIQCNKATLDFLGKSKFNEIIGHHCWELVHGSEAPVDWCPVSHMQISGKRETAIREINGKWIEISADPVYDDNTGQLVGTVHIMTDITAKKQTEDALRESEEKNKNIINNLLDTILIIDISGKFLYSSPQIYNLSGYTPEEIVGKNGFSFIHPDDLNNAINTLKNALAKRERVYIEYRTRHKDGHYIHVSSSGRIVNIEGEDKILAVISDISERIKTEKALIKEKEFTETAINAQRDTFFILDPSDGKAIRWNRAFKEITGYSDEEISTMKAPDSYYDEIDIKEAASAIEKTIEGGEALVELKLITKDGKKIPFEYITSRINDPEGNLKYIISIGRNISDKIKAEQELRESEEKFRTIAEHSFIGVLILLNDKVEYVNNALLEIFDYSKKDIVNWSKDDLIKLIHPNDLQFLREYREKLRRGEPDVKSYYSYKVFTKSGKVKWIDQFSTPIVYGTKPAELITIMDMTEKKEVEQELVKLTKIKSELLRRTSHELKTPLVSIKGFSSLLLDLYSDKLDDYVLSTIGEINQGCVRLENLIRDILKSAELDSESVQLKKTQEDLSFLIRFCVNELKGFIKLRNHKIELQLHDELTTSFEKEQIHQVLSNLLTNAIKYTPINGKIEIKSEIQDNSILISIKDNGIGFTKEEKERLFEQFGKIERYGKGLDIVSDGSGLGLYISKKIVELHGGNIWVESEGRNKGSTFYFTLPIIRNSND